MAEIIKLITELPPVPDWVTDAQQMEKGPFKVLKHELEKRYFHFGILPFDIFSMDADNSGYITIDSNDIGSMEQRLVEEVAKQKSLVETSERNNKGIALEKEGRTEEAILIYEENIKPGSWPTLHPYDRLIVLYHRLGDLQNELRVCEEACKSFDLPKYRQRLSKIQQSIKKG